jgi:hypothetical protein
MKNVIYVFYFELLANCFLIVQCLFLPATFVAGYSGQPASAAALEVARWYGVLLIPIVWLLWRALRMRGAVLRLVLQAYLAFDLVQIVVGLVSAHALGWAPYVIVVIPLELVLAAARSVCLWKPVETGIAGG